MLTRHSFSKYGFLATLVAGLFVAGMFSHAAFAQTTGFTVTTSPAAGVEIQGATLNGYAQVGDDADQKNITVWFQYGPDTSMSFATPKQGLYIQGSWASYVGGLKKNTTYYYRAVAQFESGDISYGDRQSFTTRNGTTSSGSSTGVNSPAIVSTYTATNISDSYATLNGNVDPRDSEDNERWFEWGETTSFGQTTPHQQQGTISETYSYLITGLKPNTAYYFRAASQGTGGLVFGNTFAFRTYGTGGVSGTGSNTITSIPAVSTLPAYGITNEQAILNGLVSSDGSVSPVVWFEWGIGDNLNQSTAKVTLSQQANQSYVQVLGGLSSNTMYSYRAAVQTVYGVSYGVVRTFTTGTSGAVISGGTTGGSNSNTTPCDCDTDNNPGSAQTETTGDNTSFAKSAIWWLLLILIILVIVGVAHHLWEKRKQIKEEAKRAEAAEKLQREAAVAQQASNGEKEDRITFRLPGQ